MTNVKQGRTVCIFDMDGTLYTLDGANGGYAGSTLEHKVRENAIAFIVARENCPADKARAIYARGVSDPIGLSNYFSRRYNISRDDYFTIVWDIDPAPIVQQYDTPVWVLRELKKTKVKLVLVTSAPGIWMRRVMRALGIEGVFELTFSGEQFRTKDELFKRLAGWYTPENVISVGDQETTDITPARAYGFRTLLVSGPNDVPTILEMV